MDINRLNEFIVLATHLNYSKAANQLFLTQPALSRHIHDLEQTVGAQLLIRDTHNVHLTQAGKVFFDEAQAIISRYNHAVELMQEITSTATGEINIGFLSHAAQPFLTQFVPYFNQIHPHIKLKLFCNDLDNLTRMLNEDKIDFAFVTHVDSSMFSGLVSNTVLVDRVYAAISPKNPLFKKELLYLKDFADQKMIAYSKATHPLTYDYHMQLFKKAGVPYNTVCEIESPESGIFYASINEGIFLLPAHLNFLAKGLATIPVMDESCTIPLNLLWKKNNPNPSMPIFHKEFSSFLVNETAKSSSFFS